MKLIERYIFGKTVHAAAITLLAMVGVVWIVQALKGLDIITTNGQTLFTYFSLTSLAVPLLIQAVVPLSILLATIHTINALNSNSELVVISASGASTNVLAKPLLLVALVCSLATGSIGHFISPISLIKMNQFATEMRADLVSIVLREGVFKEVEPGLTFHVAKRGENGLLSGILIADERDPNSSTIYSAKEGVVASKNGMTMLVLRDGEIQQSNYSDGSVSVIKYESYFYDLSSLSGPTAVPRLPPNRRTTVELLSPDIDEYFFKKNPGDYRAVIHERFSEMLWPFAYVFVILAFIGQARSSRAGYGTAIGWAVIMLLVARGAAFPAKGMLKADPSAVLLIYGLPIFCILFGCWFVFTNRPVALPKPLQQIVDRNEQKMRQFGERLQKSYIAFRRRRAGVET
ncbi:MAG: hypothetical protein COB78_09220 [Hyphomicrobiales bacterium]|nr:MAG: hypothetical protein COB78_09220 [Hyphomicrobiales bacterium]